MLLLVVVGLGLINLGYNLHNLLSQYAIVCDICACCALGTVSWLLVRPVYCEEHEFDGGL